MYFGIYDNKTIRQLELKGSKAILIRILEPSYLKNGIPYEIKNIDKYVNVLELYFDDILIPKLQRKSVFFSNEMAKKLNQFILENDFDEIAIHCNAGISRSPAIGLCVAKILNAKDMGQQITNYTHFFPNKQILDTFDSFDFVCKSGFNNYDIIFRNLEIYNFSDKNNNEIDKLIDGMIVENSNLKNI